jgi:hypothetical protein
MNRATRLSLALSAACLAASLLTPALAQQPITVKQIKERLVAWFESGDEDGNLGNGGYDWYKHDPKKIAETVKSRLAELADDEAQYESDCKNVSATGVKGAIDSLQNDAYDTTVADLLSAASQRGLIQEIVYNTWDITQGGDGEACSIYTYYVYFKDGTAVYLDYQHTD